MLLVSAPRSRSRTKIFPVLSHVKSCQSWGWSVVGTQWCLCWLVPRLLIESYVKTFSYKSRKLFVNFINLFYIHVFIVFKNIGISFMTAKEVNCYQFWNNGITSLTVVDDNGSVLIFIVQTCKQEQSSQAKVFFIYNKTSFSNQPNQKLINFNSTK